jgi:hypothetical protein
MFELREVRKSCAASKLYDDEVGVSQKPGVAAGLSP